MKYYRHPLVNLPSDIQNTLYLIAEELKSRKLFQTLREAGFDTSFYQPHLDSLILRSLNLDDGSDETFDMYCEIVERRSKRIESDRDSLMRQALEAYQELCLQREKLVRQENG